jgi:hypothetical protein
LSKNKKVKQFIDQIAQSDQYIERIGLPINYCLDDCDPYEIEDKLFQKKFQQKFATY